MAQTSIEDFIPEANDRDTPRSPVSKKAKTGTESEEKSTSAGDETTAAKDQDKNAQEKKEGSEPMYEDKSAPTHEHEDSLEDVANGNGAVEAHARDKDPPQEILEKGIVYFFFRARVNIEDPHDVADIARTYLILRPIPRDAKISHGPIQDEGNCRLVAIPKKTLPQTGKDKWIAFVEKGATSFEDLKKEFLASNEYNTKTMGPRTSPAATPIGEGVYAITSTGRENHLAYMLTLPEKPGEVQKEIGLGEQGSFIVSTRNPKFPAPKNAQLPDGPEFSKEYVLPIHCAVAGPSSMLTLDL
jgi:hypothetical protein